MTIVDMTANFIVTLCEAMGVSSTDAVAIAGDIVSLGATTAADVTAILAEFGITGTTADVLAGGIVALCLA